MKAWTVAEFGDYKEVMKFGEVDQPKARGTDALIEIKAIGLNFPDILMVAGGYQVKPELPFIPGTECMGEVVEKGPDCTLKVGDRIMCMSGMGAFAEYVIAPEKSRFPVPDFMNDQDAAAFEMIYQTSYFALAIRAELKEGETLLVHGGAGGVGTAAIQLGKAFGATVIATAGTDEKLDVCKRCGADHVINYATQDFVEAVKEITGGRGADVIYDPVGGDVFDQGTKCIAWNGRLVVIGFTSGRIPEIRANRILLKNISIVGLHWGMYRMHQPELIEEAQKTLVEYYEQGLIKPVIYKEFELKKLPAALETIETRVSYGKVIVTP